MTEDCDIGVDADRRPRRPVRWNYICYLECTKVVAILVEICRNYYYLNIENLGVYHESRLLTLKLGVSDRVRLHVIIIFIICI